MAVFCKGSSGLGIVVGKPPTQIPWEKEKYLGETSESDGYTSGWSSPDESDSVATYLVN